MVDHRGPPARRVIELNGRPVHYRVAGSGDPVVLVHGLSGSTRWWSRNLPALADRFTVYLVDLPGFGAMRRYWRDFVLADAAAWLLDWITALDLKKVDLIGHSMGGYICLRLAADRPGTVRRLILVAPAGVPSGRSVIGHALPMVRAGRHMPIRFLPTLTFDALRSGPGTLLRAARQLLAEDVGGYLAGVNAPTLLIWGEHDALVPPANGPILQQAIPNARLITIPRAGHVVMFDQPDQFNRTVLEFLDEAVGNGK